MFKDLGEFINDSITLPVTPGKTYTFQSPPAKVGLLIQKSETILLKKMSGQPVTDEELEEVRLSDVEETDFYRLLMGATYQQLLDDNVPDNRFKLVAAVLYEWVARGREAAENRWNDAAPKETRKAPADRKPPVKRTAAKKAAAPATSSASRGATTRSQPKKTTRATRTRGTSS